MGLSKATHSLIWNQSQFAPGNSLGPLMPRIYIAFSSPSVRR